MSNAPRPPPVVVAASAASTNLARLLDLRDLGRRYDSRVLRQWLMDQEIEQELAGLEGIPSREDDRNAYVQNYEHFQLQPTPYRIVAAGMLAGVVGTTISLVVAVASYNASEIWDGLEDPRRAAAICSTTPSLASVAPWLVSMLFSSIFEIAAVMWLARNSHIEIWDYIALVCGVGSRMVILMDVLCLVVFSHCTGSLFLTYIIVWTLSVGVGQVLPTFRSLCALLRRRDLYSMTESSVLGPVGLLWPGTWCKTVPSPAAHMPLRRGEGDTAAPGRSVSPEHGTTSSAGWYGTKLWHAAHHAGWHCLSGVLLRLYVPISALPGCEFGRSVQSYMRCYSATLVFTVLRVYFLLDYAPNLLVLVSLIYSLVTECLSCLYVVAPRVDELDDDEDWWDAL